MEKRERSTVKFPYGDIDDAIEIARGVKSWGASCTMDQLAGELRQTTSSGAFRTKVATASTFGAIRVARGNAILTEIGEALADPASNRSGRVRAFLTVPLYSQIFEKYRGVRLPSTDAGLENEIVGLGASPKVAAKARQAFQRSAQQAGFFDKGRDRLVSPNVGNGAGGLPALDESLSGGDTPPDPVIEEGMHPIIVGLIRTLPTGGKPFSKRQQERWLEAARINFELIYGGNDEEPGAPGSSS